LAEERAMKKYWYACYCCNIHWDDIAKPNNKLCDDCIEEGSVQCYHQKFLTRLSLNGCMHRPRNSYKTGPIYCTYHSRSHAFKLVLMELMVIAQGISSPLNSSPEIIGRRLNKLTCYEKS
jgi:hypothetical protein